MSLSFIQTNSNLGAVTLMTAFVLLDKLIRCVIIKKIVLYQTVLFKTIEVIP